MKTYVRINKTAPWNNRFSKCRFFEITLIPTIVFKYVKDDITKQIVIRFLFLFWEIYFNITNSYKELKN